MDPDFGRYRYLLNPDPKCSTTEIRPVPEVKTELEAQALQKLCKRFVGNLLKTIFLFTFYNPRFDVCGSEKLSKLVDPH